ncbi:unnamed protein product, partial [Porites lobata]
ERPGPSTPAKSADPTPSTSAVSEGFWASAAKAISRDLRPGLNRRLRWLGHVSCMQDGRIPKNVLYGELCHWNQTCRGPPRRFIEVCKRDLKAGNINPAAWEAVAVDRSHRRLAFRRVRRETKRRRLWAASVPKEPYTEFICNNCNRA